MRASLIDRADARLSLASGRSKDQPLPGCLKNKTPVLRIRTGSYKNRWASLGYVRAAASEGTSEMQGKLLEQFSLATESLS